MRENGENPLFVNYVPRVYAYLHDGTIKIVNTDNNWNQLTRREAEGLMQDLKVCLKATGNTGSPSIRRKQAVSA